MAERDNLPGGRTGHVAAKYGEYMLVWGGYKEHEENQAVYFSGSELWVYLFCSEKWSLKKCNGESPPGTSGAVALLLQDHLYVFGGYQEEGNTNALFRLNLSNFTWDHLSPKGFIPSPVDKLVGWKYDCKLYFFGGFGIIPQNNTRDQSPFQFLPGDIYSSVRRGWTNQFMAYDPKTDEWVLPTTTGKLPTPRAAHAAALVNNIVYIFGGRHQNSRLNDLHCLNMDTMEWSGPLPVQGSDGVLPEGRSWHSLNALSENSLVLYGGFSQNDMPLSDCWILDLSIMKWKKVDLGFSKPRLWHTACVSTFEEVIIYGGCTQNILDHRIAAEHGKDIIVLRFSPKSLFRLCIDIVVKHHIQLSDGFDILPASIQRILKGRLLAQCAANLYGS